MNHISIDIETLGTSKTAPIIQIAAVKFSPDTSNPYGYKIISTFGRNILLESNEDYGNIPEFQSVYWWVRQHEDARDLVFNQTNAVSLLEAIVGFNDFIGKAKEQAIWTHTTFDPPILQHAAKVTSTPLVIPFRDFKDIRTLELIAGKPSIEFKGTRHDALSDAVYQAQYVSAMLNKLEYQKYRP